MNLHLVMEFFLFVLGVTGVYFGAHFLVSGASGLALSFGVRPIIIGMTLVAFATSLPELVVSLSAQFSESQSIAFGNILGSNIANIALILGTASVVRPLSIDFRLFKFEMPVMAGFSVLLILMALNLTISRLEGVALIVLMAVFLWFYLRKMGHSVEAEAEQALQSAPHKRWKNGLIAMAGLVILVGGAQLMVQSAVYIARYFHISEVVIGISIVAIGTSIPELATSVVATIRRQAEISIGNVIGSNIFNVALVLGLACTIIPMQVPPRTITFDGPIMLLFTFALYPMIRPRLTLGRISGTILLAGYAGYIFLLFSAN